MNKFQIPELDIHGQRSTRGRLSTIYLYPIKSCGSLKVTQGSWPLSKTSLKYDRQFVIMQGKTTLTQKNEPQLTQIQPKIDLKTETMTLSVPWMTSTCQVILNKSDIDPGSMTLCSGKVCGDKIEGIDCGDKVADWLEEALGLTGLRLIKLMDRKSSLQSLANEAQFLCLNRSSAGDLMKQIQNSLEPHHDLNWIIEQFRGNLVFDGFSAYSEELWKTIQIGREVILQSNGPCTRCNVISINQENSEKVQQPLQYLAKNERHRFKFGLLAGSFESMEGLNLTIGDDIYITF